MARNRTYISILRLVTVFLICALALGGCKGKKKSSSRQGARTENYDPTRSRSSQLEDTEKAGNKTSIKETKAVPPGKVAETVISNAKKYAGTPYKWGGTTRAGMDCSGLLFMSCQEAQVAVPRISSEQASFGKNVPLRDLQPGDWVFFSSHKGSKKIVHAGMVTEVKGSDHIRFIHSSTKLGVVESDFNAPYYREIFVKAVRPF